MPKTRPRGKATVQGPLPKSMFLDFLGLPAELRNQIYGYLLIDSRFQKVSHSKHTFSAKWREPGLLLASHQTRAESAAIYYAINKFDLRVELDKEQEMVKAVAWLQSTKDNYNIEKFEDIHLHIFKPEWRYLANFLPLAQFIRKTGLKVEIITHTMLKSPERAQDMIAKSRKQGTTIFVILPGAHNILQAFRTLLTMGAHAPDLGLDEKDLQESMEAQVLDFFKSGTGKRCTNIYEADETGLRFPGFAPHVLERMEENRLREEQAEAQNVPPTSGQDVYVPPIIHVETGQGAASLYTIAGTGILDFLDNFNFDALKSTRAATSTPYPIGVPGAQHETQLRGDPDPSRLGLTYSSFPHGLNLNQYDPSTAGPENGGGDTVHRYPFHTAGGGGGSFEPLDNNGHGFVTDHLSPMHQGVTPTYARAVSPLLRPSTHRNLTYTAPHRYGVFPAQAQNENVLAGYHATQARPFTSVVATSFYYEATFDKDHEHHTRMATSYNSNTAMDPSSFIAANDNDHYSGPAFGLPATSPVPAGTLPHPLNDARQMFNFSDVNQTFAGPSTHSGIAAGQVPGLNSGPSTRSGINAGQMFDFPDANQVFAGPSTYSNFDAGQLFDFNAYADLDGDGDINMNY